MGVKQALIAFHDICIGRLISNVFHKMCSPGTKSAITAVVTHFLDRNHTALLTGHEDGSIRKHVVLDKVIR